MMWTAPFSPVGTAAMFSLTIWKISWRADSVWRALHYQALNYKGQTCFMLPQSRIFEKRLLLSNSQAKAVVTSLTQVRHLSTLDLKDVTLSKNSSLKAATGGWWPRSKSSIGWRCGREANSLATQLMCVLEGFVNFWRQKFPSHHAIHW